jgi:hypothetical protein
MAGLVPNWFDVFAGGSGSSFGHQVQVGQNIAVGDSIIVVFAWFDNFGAGVTVSSVSDATANSYTQYGTYTRSGTIGGGQINSGVFICDVASASATRPTITITLSTSETGGIGIGYLNYTNQTSTPRDQISTGQQSLTTALACASLTTNVANELVITWDSTDIGGNPRTAPTLTGSTPDVNYITRVNQANNSTSQDLIVVDRGSSTDPNGQIGASVAVVPRWNSSGTWHVIDDFLLLASSGAQDTPELSGRPFGLMGRSQMSQLLSQ